MKQLHIDINEWLPWKGRVCTRKDREVFKRLPNLPESRTYPKELSVLGVHDLRDVFFKPNRIIYRVERSIVYVYLIADGRRDMQVTLSRRPLNT